MKTKPGKRISDGLILKTAGEVLFRELEAVKALRFSLGPGFAKAIKLLNSCGGRVIVTGLGKSGIIAKKISATLSSTGTPSTYMHPVEAIHGDMGVLCEDDVIISLSNSGQTEELNKLITLLKKRGFKIISITNNPSSKMARHSDITLNLNTKREACPYNLVPTSTTTAMLVLGDAIAVTLMKIKGFGSEKFADLHPGGNLGKLLNLKVGDIMRTGRENPVINQDVSLGKALALMTSTALGAVSISDKKGRLAGFFTDGDLRRKVSEINLGRAIKFYMTPRPTSVTAGAMAVEAALLMQKKRIDNMPVVDGKGRVIGIIDERDLLKEGLL